MSNYITSAGQYIGQVYDESIVNERKKLPPLIHVLDGQTDEILDVIGRETPFWDDLHRRLLKNYEETFDFQTIPDSRASEYLRERNRLIIPTEDGFFREFIIDEHVQNRDSLEVYSTASYLELAKARPIEPATYSGSTVNTMTDTVLNATGWQRGITEYAGSRTITWEDWETPFSALKKIASEFELELRFRIETLGSQVVRRYVDLIERQGEWRGREITSGKDLINAKRTENTAEVITALVGLGPEREDGTREIAEITNEEARQAWGRDGRHLWGIHEIESDNQEMTQAEVEQYTTTELNKRIAAAVQYEVDGADLEQILGRSHEQIRLGDDVRVKATEYNPAIYLDARIIGVESPISDRSQKTYTLGEFIEYSEEDINQLKNYLKKLIGLKVSEEKVRNITYDKETIDNKDTQVKTDISNGEVVLPGNAVEYPDDKPPAPTNFQAEGLFKVISLRWDYDPSGYISDYEVYASPTPDFTPSEVYLIYKGDVGGCVHEANVNETWYYKLRAVNTHGTGSDYVTNSASTLQIDADTEIAEQTITKRLLAAEALIDSVHIGEAVINSSHIKELSADLITSGKVKAERVEVGSAAEQLILNSTFMDGDDGFKNWSQADTDHWGTKKSGFTGAMFEGANVAKTIVSGETENQWYSINSYRVPCTAGETFSVGVYSHVDDLTTIDAGFDMEFEWYDDTGARISTTSKSITPSQNDVWEYFANTANAPANCVEMNVRFHMNRNGTGYVAKPMLVRGKVPLPHQKHFTEIPEYSLTFDKLRGSVAVFGGVDNTNGRMMVLDANGEVIADLDAADGGFNELYVGTMDSPSIINTNYDDYSIYVDPVNGDDNANGGTAWDDAFETIRGALDSIPRYNNGIVTILTANGGEGYTYNEFIRIQGFEGGGEIVLDFRTPIVNNLTGRINITNCTNSVRVKNVIVQHDANTNSVIGQWGGRAYFESVIIYGNGTAEDGFYCHGGNMELRNCEVYDLTGERNCIKATMNGSIYVVDCKGLGGVGLRGHSGGWFSGYGTQPMGDTAKNNFTSGSFSHATFTEDAGSATPPAPPETTKQWKASSASNWSSSGYWSESYPKQGNWGYGRRTGYWFFGSSPSTAVTGKTISRIRVTIKRKSEGGYSSKVPIRLRWHTHTSKPSSPSDVNLSSDYKDVSLAWGKSATVTLPSSFHADFENGTAKGIGIYYGSDSRSYYAAMEASATLEITYQ